MFTFIFQVHRLVIVDNENRVIGIISLSDILTYIVLKCDQSSQKLGKLPPPPYHDTLNNNSKTASLTQAFGLTRLSTSQDHVILNEANNNTANSSTGAHTPGNLQPQMSNDHGTIFEDDPMETEQQLVKS